MIKRENKDYIMINKRFLEDTNLSLRAKGLLGYLLSLPNGSKIYKGGLINGSADDEKSLDEAIQELMKNNYIKHDGFGYVISEG